MMNINGNYITAVKPGIQRLKISYGGCSDDTIMFDFVAESLTSADSSVSISENGNYQLAMTYTQDNKVQEIIWNGEQLSHNHYINSYDVTTSCSYTSNNTAVAAVSPSTGQIWAVKAGSATITANYGGVIATVPVTVKPLPAGSSITPNPAAVYLNQTGQLSVTTTFNDGSQASATSGL